VYKTMPSYELSVVIPVYNEDENIITTIQSLHKVISVNHEIICVYDFEEDTTVPILSDLMYQFSQLKMIKNKVARGPSGAIRAGIQHSTAPHILVVMADACDDFSQIPHLLTLGKEKDSIVCPSRYCKGGSQLLDPSLKVWLPQTAGFMLKSLTGIPTYDPTNSFKMYSAKIFDEIELQSTVSFSVTLEIITKAFLLGYHIIEVPTTWRNRTKGVSNFKLLPSIPAYLKWFLLCLFKRFFFKTPQGVRFPPVKENF
jgi:dolichol-phosphate mannosyltransferase